MFERARCRVNHANSGEKEPEIHTESRLIFKKATHLRGLQVPLGKPHKDFARLELNRPGREAGPAFNQCSGWGLLGGVQREQHCSQLHPSTLPVALGTLGATRDAWRLLCQT